MIEFSLLTVVWVPLLLGTMWIGSAMVREQDGAIRAGLARDGHGFAGVDALHAR